MTDRMREEFEKWYLERNPHLLGNIHIDGKNYLLKQCQNEWQVWQAAWNTRHLQSVDNKGLIEKMLGTDKKNWGFPYIKLEAKYGNN